MCFYCIPAYGSSIHLSSEEHRIWGFAGGQEPGETFEDYDRADDTQVSAQATGAYFIDDSLEESLSQAFAGITSGAFTIKLSAGRWAAEAYGTSSYTFTASQPNLCLTASGFTGQTDLSEIIDFSIFDDTLQGEIYSYTFQAFIQEDQIPVFTFDFSDQLTIIPDRTYRLQMNAEALRGDSLTSSQISLSLFSHSDNTNHPHPVPEPGTILFFCLGFCLLSKRARS